MRKWTVLALLLLVSCTREAPAPLPEPASSTPTAEAASSAPAAQPSPSPSSSSTTKKPERAVAPSVEGDWQEIDMEPATTEAAIDAADLPDGLKEFLKSALLDEVIESEEWADEFPDCPVEAQITALHPAGFAVGMVQGCGPDGRMGVFKQDGDEWRDAALVGHAVPECTQLAEEGVPGDIPYEWDEGFRCQDSEQDWRYW